MLPVHRWLVCTLGVLMSDAALAQTAATAPVVDESKIPEWVKRQARSPYKVIGESSTARARAPVPVLKDDSTARLAKKAATAAAATPVAAPATAVADAPATTAAASTSTPEP